jgi:hypothetical protein
MLEPLLVTVLLTVLIIPSARAEQSDPTFVVFASVLPIQTLSPGPRDEKNDQLRPPPMLITTDHERAHADHDHAHPGHEAGTHRHEAGTHHQHGAHVHGVAMLNVALDSDELLIELTSPAMNLVGFEHAPRDAAQRDAVAEARRALAEPDRLIRINPEADCTLAESHAMLELGEHAAAAHDPTQSATPSHATEVHADGHGEYHWRCAHPGRLAHIELPLFDVFPGTERIAVQLITPTDQSASELTSDNRRLDL